MGLTYNPDKDIPDLTGKVFLVTGGTGGLGKEMVVQLAKHNPKHIYFTGRNAQAAEAVIAETKIATFIPCDATSLSSVRQAAKSFLQKSGNQLDVLVCNAGVMASPPGVSKDGYEIQFAINHLSHALLIKLCLPTLQRAADEKGEARIVSVSSLAFRSAPPAGIIFKDLKSSQKNLGYLAKWVLYAQSKLTNILYASQLSKHYPKITTLAVHPGVINTGLASHLSALDRIIVKLATLRLLHLNVREGTYNQLWAATTTDKKGVKSGEMYEPVGRAVEHTKLSKDEALAEELWEWTEKELAAYS